MFCKWCGNTIKSTKGACSACGKDIQPMADCGGWYDLRKEVKKAPPAPQKTEVIAQGPAAKSAAEIKIEVAVSAPEVKPAAENTDPKAAAKNGKGKKAPKPKKPKKEPSLKDISKYRIISIVCAVVTVLALLFTAFVIVYTRKQINDLKSPDEETTITEEDTGETTDTEGEKDTDTEPEKDTDEDENKDTEGEPDDGEVTDSVADEYVPVETEEPVETEVIEDTNVPEETTWYEEVTEPEETEAAEETENTEETEETEEPEETTGEDSDLLKHPSLF